LAHYFQLPCFAIFGTDKIIVLYDKDPFKSLKDDFLSYASLYKNIDCLPEKRKDTVDFFNGILDKRKNKVNRKWNEYTRDIGVSSKKVPDLNRSFVLYLHDFFDAPNKYGRNIFSNHVEWVSKTVDFFKKKNIGFYIKTHPSWVKKNEGVFDEIVNKYNIDDATILRDVSNQDVYSAKPLAILTVYGHVALEAPYFGIPIISAGASPGEAFRFTLTPTDQNDYYQKIENLFNGDIKVNVDREDVIVANIVENYKHEADTYNIPLKNFDINTEKFVFGHSIPFERYENRKSFYESSVLFHNYLDTLYKQGKTHEMFEEIKRKLEVLK